MEFVIGAFSAWMLALLLAGKFNDGVQVEDFIVENKAKFGDN